MLKPISLDDTFLNKPCGTKKPMVN